MLTPPPKSSAPNTDIIMEESEDGLLLSSDALDRQLASGRYDDDSHSADSTGSHLNGVCACVRLRGFGCVHV